MRLFGFDLKLKVDRYKFIILFFGTLLFLLVGTGAGLKITSSSSFCSACHVMAPEVATWQVSSHSQIACIECHIEPGVENMLKQKASGLKHLYAQVTGEYYLPIRQVMPIESSACLKCHSLDREFSPSGDLVIPHKIHYDKKVSCVRCHSGIAHGNIAGRRATVTGSLAEWDLAKGKEQMQIQNTKTPMDDCMKCHARREGPLECSACHTSSKKPISHKKSNFISTHGKEAITELDTCNLCHGYSGYVGGEKEKVDYSKKRVKTERSLVSLKLLIPGKERPIREIVEYSRNNRFCIDCHSKKPKNHESPTFANYHSLEGKKSSGTCFTCHSNRPEELNPVTKTTCSSCHPSSHSRDWKAFHPIEVKGKLDKSCFSCHSENTCISCHTVLKSLFKPKVNTSDNISDNMEGE